MSLGAQKIAKFDNFVFVKLTAFWQDIFGGCKLAVALTSLSPRSTFCQSSPPPVNTDGRQWWPALSVVVFDGRHNGLSYQPSKTTADTHAQSMLVRCNGSSSLCWHTCRPKHRPKGTTSDFSNCLVSHLVLQIRQVVEVIICPMH